MRFSSVIVLALQGSQFFSENVDVIWNGLPSNVDFSSLASFIRSINSVDFSK